MTLSRKVVIAGRIPETHRERIRAEFPDITLVACEGNRERFRAELVDAHVVCGKVRREEFALASRLEFIHSTNVGVESLDYPELQASPVIVTNSRGVHCRAMAEFVVAVILALYRNLPAMRDAQRESRWEPLPRERFVVLENKVVGLLGTGAIGDMSAKLCQALGCQIIGYNAGGRPTDHVERVFTGADLPAFLTKSDVVVNSLPHTPRTRGLIGADQFHQMKPTAIFVNVGRGATIDEAVLATALRERWIAGAGLDVFVKEPLPRESPLWTMSNVIISPHQSSDDPEIRARVYDLFVENLRRYRAGRPLLNVVNKAKGY